SKHGHLEGVHGRGAAGREGGVTEYASLRPSARREAKRRDRDGNSRSVRELHVFTTPQQAHGVKRICKRRAPSGIKKIMIMQMQNMAAGISSSARPIFSYFKCMK